MADTDKMAKPGRPVGRTQDTFLKIRIQEDVKQLFMDECERRQISSAMVLRFLIEQWLEKTSKQKGLEDLIG